MQVFQSDGEARGFETITTITTAKGFTSTQLVSDTRPCKSALVTCETADVRFTLDGTTPTVTAGTGAGHLLVYGDSFMVRGQENVRNFRAINAVNASGSVLKVTYLF